MQAAKTKSHALATHQLMEDVFRELIRTQGLLERVMQPCFARFGISGSQWGILRTLHRAEGEGLPGLRQTDLSERLFIRPPSVTGALERLERAGLVTRVGSTTDLRAKQVALSDSGRQLIERAMPGRVAQIDTIMGGLSTGDQQELRRLLAMLREHLEQMVVRSTTANIG
jgi:DNA-binding MarR family transcriptional regulator